ncbi:hypothetical protein [Nonomuraea dietziae]|uniref:hypothetical protein n=1 Tax=Nonomuraea dietziae TaxID=65515 RepID=UPI0034151D5E
MTTSRRRLPTTILLSVMGAVTVAMLAVGLHIGGLVTALWLLAPLVEGVAYLVALAVYVPVMTVLVRRRGVAACAAGLVLTIAGLAAPVTLQFTPELRVPLRFHLERFAFTQVAELAREGKLPAERLHSYLGAELPSHLCFVSANCRVSALGTSGGRPVLFLPDWLGIPDDALGYAHFTGEATGSFDAYGMRVCPTTHLGDGWWWMDRCRGPRRS